jgi:hypothetical protein
MLKESRGWKPALRYGVYAAVWLAYFILMTFITAQVPRS